MTLYDNLMHPLESRYLRTIRQAVIPQAAGRTLEIGVGSGANSSLYDHQKVSSLTGLDVRFSSTAKERLAPTMTLQIGQCEHLPYPDDFFDTVVTTLVLCSVTDLSTSINEIKRVLKNTGHYLFIEHVLPEKTPFKVLFKLANPAWQLATNGCHLTRSSDDVMLAAGLRFDSFHKNPSGILCYGIARKLDN